MTVASCRRLEVDESMNALRECKATAEEDSWSGLNQVRERVRKNQPRRSEKPRRGVERETREIRQDFEKSEAVLGSCSFDFDGEGDTLELDFAAVEHCGDTLVAGCWGFAVKETQEAARGGQEG